MFRGLACLSAEPMWDLVPPSLDTELCQILPVSELIVRRFKEAH